jgi:hypothetical protein
MWMWNHMTRQRIVRNVYVMLNAMKRVSTGRCFTSAMIRIVHLIVPKTVQIALFNEPQFVTPVMEPDLVDLKYSEY